MRHTNYIAEFSSSRLPLIVRTVADVEILRVNSRAIRRLPPKGLKVEIDGIKSAVTEAFEARLRAYIRACGCAEGAICALIILLGFVVFIAFRISAHGVQWNDLGIAVIGLFLAVLIGGVGKLLALTIARFRFERCCDQVIRTIKERQ